MREGNLSISDLTNQPHLLEYINSGIGTEKKDNKPYNESLRSSSPAPSSGRK
jgi:hypothetical protein